MSRIALIYSIVFTLILSHISTAQISTLDPLQTVNPATGEMGFSLPLGSVKGVNGKEFPVTVNYKAGILTAQEASAVGLGFSYGPGGITRKVNFVPDDNTGGPTSFEKSNMSRCTKPWYYWIVVIGTSLLSYIITCFANAAGSYVGSVVWMFVSTAFDISMSMHSAYVQTSAYDFKAGGPQTPKYMPMYASSDPGHGKGFLNGGVDDIPDMYFVNTPFVNGQMVWLGSPDKNNGRFVFNQTNGGIGKDDAVTKVTYTNGCFYLTLADGTRLFFDKIQRGKPYSKIYFQEWDGDAQCIQTHTQKQIEPIAQQWLLTKVLYADYVDGDNDINDNPLSSSNNKGSWIVFEYEEIVSTARALPECNHAGTGTAVVAHSGNYLDDIYLRWIKTPNQKAEYVYTDNRQDNFYFDEAKMQWWDESDEGLRNRDPAEKICRNKTTGTLQPINRKVLDHVIIYNCDAKPITTVTFKTDYKLRPNSLHSYSKDNAGNYVIPDQTKNPDAACLTLQSITISGIGGIQQPPIRFVYSGVNPSGFTQQVGQTAVHEPLVKYYKENRDYWGFYSTKTDEFNADGDNTVLQNSHAWSLESVIFPTGMQIQWEYEPNRYCKANNQSVTGMPSKDNPSILMKTKYGGGIRVKKVTVLNGMQKVKDYSFFYRSVNDFNSFADERDGLSSGHATADICPYMLEQSADKRANAARGGNYTPAKVAYEMVQIVENYNSITKTTPLGYTGYTFVTNADQGCANTGLYGDGDNSWMRGMMKSKIIYDKNGKAITSTNWDYGYQYIGSTIEPVAEAATVRVELEPSESKDACNVGWVYLKSITTSDHDVKKKQEFSYSTDLNYTEDITKERLKRVEKVSWAIGPSETYNDYSSDDELISSRSSRIMRVLNFSGSKYFVTAMTNWRKYGSQFHINLLISPNFIGAEGPVSPCTWGNKQIDATDLPNFVSFPPLPIIFQDYIITGLDMIDLDNNGKPDLLIEMSGQIGHGSSAMQTLYAFALKDVAFTNGVLSYSLSKTDKFFYKELGANTPGQWGQPLYRTWCSAVGEIDNDAQPDLVYTTVNTETGDATLNAYMNISAELVPITTKTLQIQALGGKKQCRFMALNDDNKLNDLVFNKNLHDRTTSYLVLNNIDGSGTLVKGETTLPPNKISMQSTKVIGFFGADFVNNNNMEYEICAVDQCIDEKVSTTGNENIDVAFISQAEIQLDRDGQPNLSIVKPVVGTSFEPIATVSTPAYLKYPAMLTDAHVLTPSCQTITYKGSIANNKPVSTSVTKWQNFATIGTKKVQWLPLSNYKWNVTMNQLGETGKTPVYNFEDEKQNSTVEWAIVDSITKVSSNGSVVETAIPKSTGGDCIYSATIIRHKNNLPVATIRNARYDECAVFTCNYNDGQDPDYFDKENGWKKGGSIFNEDMQKYLFGFSDVIVNGTFGPTKNITTIDPNKSYTFSAWVYPRNDNHMRFTVEPHRDNSALPSSANYDDFVTGLQKDKWQFVTRTISSERLKGWELDGKDGDYLRLWIGNYCEGNTVDINKAYFDVQDIRFAPSNALITTMYYDPYFGLPNVVVDANNNPGKRITYDGLGRPVKWEKYDLTKKPDDAGYLTQVMKKEYYLRSEFLASQHICLYYPNGKELFIPGQDLVVGWEMLEQGSVTISYKKEGDAAYTDFVTQPYTAGQHNYTWSIPGELGGDYKIKVTNTRSDGTTCSDESDATFRINAVAIQAPISTSEWMAGTKRQIKWSFSGPSTVDIYYDNGTSRILIASNINNNGGNGTYEWEIPLDYKTERNSKIVITNHEISGQFIESQTFLIVERSRFIQKWLMGLFGK